VDWKDVVEMLYQITYQNKEKVYFINKSYEVFTL